MYNGKWECACICIHEAEYVVSLENTHIFNNNYDEIDFFPPASVCVSICIYRCEFVHM